MGSDDPLDASGRERLARIVAECSDRLSAGEHLDIAKIVAEHPDLGPDLAASLEGLCDMQAALKPTQPYDRIGDYQIVAELGRGGMGIVYEAWDAVLGRRVALKVLPAHSTREKGQRERFEREARSAARLQHPNIVPVYRVGEDRGICFYVMRLIHGTGLDSVLREIGRLRTESGLPHLDRGASESNLLTTQVSRLFLRGDMRELKTGEDPRVPGSGWEGWESSAGLSSRQAEPDGGEASDGQPSSHPGSSPSVVLLGSESDSSSGSGVSDRYYRSVAQLGLQVAQALSYAHGEGVLHRDIKPSNLLLDLQGTIWVTDFGLAKASDSQDLTQTGELVGTLPYMPPERFQGWSDPRSDIYGLGLTLYECLTFRRAFADSRRERLVHRIEKEHPRVPRQIDRRIPRDLETIVLKMIEKEPGDRYATAAAVAQDLEAFLTDRPIRARRSSLAERAWRWCRRNRIVAGLTALTVLSLTVGFVVSVWFALESRENAERAEQRLDEVLQLSDVKNLADYRAEAHELWPASSRNVKAMSEWLEKAKKLVASAEGHRAILKKLRGKALPYTEEDRTRDRRAHPKAGELEEAKRRRSALEEKLEAIEAEGQAEAAGRAELRQRLGKLEVKIAELDAEVSSRRTWSYADPRDAWWHNTLEGFLTDLGTFADPDPTVGTIASVERRFEFARTVRQRTLDDHEERWKEAIASIADIERCPRYGGLEIQPQEGLIPLGQDPESGLWEFAHLQTGDAPEREDDGRLILTEETGLVFVLLPGGTFRMGAVRPTLGARFSGASGRLRIEEVAGGSLAAMAGARTGDILVALNGEELEIPGQLQTLINNLRSDQTVSLTVVRQGERKTLHRKLSTNVDRHAEAREGPVHEVTLAPFFLSKYEMTQGQWLRFTGENPSQFQPGVRIGENEVSLLYPVEMVNWGLSVEVLRRLAFTLPTEAQWEYACRGGTTTIWWTGDEKASLRGAANFSVFGSPRHVPVGTYRANAFGLHEIVGNVWEWCRDWYGPYTAPVNPGDGRRKVGPGRHKAHTIRGATWADDPGVGRSAARTYSEPGHQTCYVGVRPARKVQER